MAMKNRIVAFVAGVLLGPAIVWAGLETGTYISDLVATNPLSSDLASTADDHIRLLKSTIKTTFPNINNAVTVTDEQLNTVATNVAANPTGTIGLTGVNGSASTYLRSDGAPALSQAIAPTWSATHTYDKAFVLGSAPPAVFTSALPLIELDESDAAANNRRWWINASGGVFQMGTGSDDRNSGATFMSATRSGTTATTVVFATLTGGAHRIGGTVTSASAGAALMTVDSDGSVSAAQMQNSHATIPAVYIGTGQTGNAAFAHFYEANDPDQVLGSITSNGSATAYNTSSDARLKTNFQPAPSAVKLINCILIESYDWKSTGEHVEHGLVAQRLANCAPYAVTQGKVWQVSKADLVPALIKYVQEQDARIAALERRLR
jgi:hypothetical protein